MGEYKYILYEVGDDGIDTITLNRPPVNAFNREMSGELIMALDRFSRADDERVLILTGAGRVFSTGEDLSNINLDASIPEMRRYAEEALGHYHQIVRAILLTGKPIIAMLNGVAAGAGMSIALACDQRFALIGDLTSSSYEAGIFVPAFADMGLIADAGLTATLSRLVGRQEAQKLCDTPGMRLSVQNALELGILDGCSRSCEYCEEEGLCKCRGFMTVTGDPLVSECSSLARRFSKEIRNKTLVHDLNRNIFPWEKRAQACCLASDYFRERAKAFLAKPKAKREKK